MRCARGVGIFEGRLRGAIHALKFGRCRAMATVLGELMARLVAEDVHLHADLIVPIPLHPRRLRERGFNQAELLAREVARVAMGRVDTTLLMRVRETRSQTELSRQERALNLTGAFEASRPVSERRVLLVDDVISTGATANECAGVLRRAGAGEVAVVVAAMALPERARR